MNICWYSDDELSINFNSMPEVSMRYISKSNTKQEINEITKKPFINNNDLKVILFDFCDYEKYEFLIPKGYSWDGATIPRIFWRLIGSKTDNRFLIPSLIHDYLCENHDCIDNNRYFSSKVFDKLLIVSNVNPLSRWLIFHSVDNYQKFCGW